MEDDMGGPTAVADPAATGKGGRAAELAAQRKSAEEDAARRAAAATFLGDVSRKANQIKVGLIGQKVCLDDPDLVELQRLMDVLVSRAGKH